VEPAFILHDDEDHREHTEAEAEELKLREHHGLHKKPAAPCITGSRKRRQTGIDSAAHPPGREAPRSSSSDDDTGNLTVLPLA
jgi:hypothetical protein